MTDSVFTPTRKDPATKAPGSAELVYLAETLFVIKGVFNHPLTNKEAPLPPHRWALVNKAEKLFLEGTTSDDQGLSTILKKDPGGADDSEWALYLIPIFKDKADTSEVVTTGEVWIDVDVDNKDTNKTEWVRASELEAKPRIEKRRTIRLPRWTSVTKAKSGGFKESPPSASGFKDTGLLKKSELVPHGTRNTPWTIEIDHKWLKTFVQFQLYDAKNKKHTTVPQGLVLEAIAMTGETYERVGASSARRKDGSIYMLHAREEASSTNLEYLFRTPSYSTFTYKDGTWASPKERMTDWSRLENEYATPLRWHSFGTEAWEGPKLPEPKSSTRKKFSELRTKGTESKPLCFHLDDVVLVRGTRPIILDAKKKRIAIYTAVAGLHDPPKAKGRDLPYSKYELTKFPMRAEDAIIRSGEKFDKQTLFFDYEGQIYHLDGGFVMGKVGETPHVGTRAAALAFPIADNESRSTMEVRGGHRVYLVDARWVQVPYDGKQVRLAHVICYVSCFVEDDKATQNPDAKETIESWLVESARRWDQKHPGNPDTSAKKDYAIISKDKFKAGATLVKVCHIFGLRSDKIGSGTKDTPQPITIRVLSQPGRASAGPTMHLFCIDGGTMDENVIDPDWASGKTKPKEHPYEFELPDDDKWAATDRVDDVRLQNLTIAHELGHESGLLDEYLEGINIRKDYEDATEFIPQFRQSGFFTRPYAMDTHGMMNSNRLPRLRYIYNHVDQLHVEAAATPSADHWLKAERPFIAEYKSKKRTLHHSIPRVAPDFKPELELGPWHYKTKMQGLCNVTFYPTSDDEGTIGPVFVDEGTLANPMDGILVVHPMFWLRFDAKMKKTKKQWKSFAEWAKRYSASSSMTRFLIETSGVTYAQRVAILLQPRFEFSPIVSDSPSRDLTTCELLIHDNDTKPSVTAGSPPVLSVDEDDVGNWIFRWALNQPAKLTPNDEPTKASDLTILATVLKDLLGRKEVGTIKAYP